jgi:hypothetical protein
VCRVWIGGGVLLNRPGADSGRFDVPSFATNIPAAVDEVVAGQGSLSVTLVDGDQRRSNTLTIPVPGEPAPGACAAGSPLTFVVF